MKKELIATVIMASIASAPMTTYASTTSPAAVETENTLSPQATEEIGFGAGALIGAIFGGPAGAFITGLAGNLIAKTMNAEDEITQLQTSQTSQQETFDHQLASLRNTLKQTQQNHQQELIALEQGQVNANQYALTQIQAENLLMSLQFTTGSSTIPDYYQGQLTALAELLKQSPNINVDLSGYTDLLGDSDINLALSSARAESVKHQLAALGVAESRINTFAYGDSNPIVANAQQQSSFYDRRVMIKLHQQPSQVAKNH